MGASDAWDTFLSFLIGLLAPFFSNLTHSSRLMLLKCSLSSWYFPIHNIKPFPGGFGTKSELFCFAFKVLQNHLALLFFQIRSVSFLSYRNITTPASVPLCKHVKLTWPKRTHPSAYFFNLPSHLCSSVTPCSSLSQVLAVPWKHQSLGLWTCFLLHPWSPWTKEAPPPWMLPLSCTPGKIITSSLEPSRHSTHTSVIDFITQYCNVLITWLPDCSFRLWATLSE